MPIAIIDQKMLQFPSFMPQFPSPAFVLPSSLIPSTSPHSHSEELLLAVEEAAVEDEKNEIRKTNSNITVIGKTVHDDDKDDMDTEGNDDDADNVEKFEGDEFDQETG